MLKISLRAASDSIASRMPRTASWTHVYGRTLLPPRMWTGSSPDRMRAARSDSGVAEREPAIAVARAGGGVIRSPTPTTLPRRTIVYGSRYCS